MPDDRLRDFANKTARKIGYGAPLPDAEDAAFALEAAERFGPSPSLTPAEIARYRPPEPELPAEMEADAASEEMVPEWDTSTPLASAASDAVRSWQRAPMEKLDLDAEAGEPAETPFATTPRGFIDAALAAQDEIAAEYGLSPEEYVTAFAALSQEEFAAATGLPPEAQPGRRDLGRSGQALLDAETWRSHVAKLRAQGRHFE
jgi:hypothetical protein